jgi:hypothetical protein
MGLYKRSFGKSNYIKHVPTKLMTFYWLHNPEEVRRWALNL